MGRILIAEGHDVAFLSGRALHNRIEGIGTKFHVFPGGADFNLRDFESVAPELKSIPPGPDWLRVATERVFVDPVPAQHKGLQQVLGNFAADVIIGDDMLFGVLPMLRTAFETALHRSLRHIVFALAPRRRSSAFYRLAARNYEGAARRLRGDLS
jgi:hypothetical protein